MMQRSELLSYPLIMLAALALFVWAAVSTSRAEFGITIPIPEQVYGGLLLLVGFVLAAIVDIFGHRRRTDARARQASRREFDATSIHEMISVYPPTSFAPSHTIPPWELTSLSLVGHDNSLALAKLRLDLEHTLRELAVRRRIDLSRKGATAITASEILILNSALPADFAEPIRQVVAVCNRAIHGEKISDDLAELVVSLGEELIGRLRQLTRDEVNAIER